MKQPIFLFSAFLAVVLGCGGAGTTSTQGSVSGLVLDQNGDPVRGARVFTTTTPPRETFTTTSGSYILSGVEAVDLVVFAEIAVGNTNYSGQNVARVFTNEQAQNTNILVAPTARMATINGTVTGTRGTRVQFGRISAKPVNTSLFSSNQTLTNNNGDFTLSGLISGVNYQIVASYPGFQSSEIFYTPQIGNNVTNFSFSLRNSGNPLLPAPQNLIATAWTTVPEATRSTEQKIAIDNVKKFLNPRYKKNKVSRKNASNGNPIEIQLYWDKIDSLELLGYGIYRQRSNDTALDIDFLRDPLADGYLDSDPEIRDGVPYRYDIFAGNTNYPNDNSFSDFSNGSTVTPLGGFNSANVNVANNGVVTFNWSPVSGAANYSVYVFDQYPGLGISAYDNNFNNPATGTSFVYNLRPLAAGQRYYYLVLAANSDDSAKSLSAIGQFTAR
jgi:hypothetical protein